MNKLLKDYSLGEKIRIYRILRGYSQAGLASQAGLTQGQISNIETNKYKREIEPEVLKAILKSLDISEDGLAGFGTKQDNYTTSLEKLSSGDKDLYKLLESDGDLLDNLLASMNSLIQLNDFYRQKLRECEESKAGN